MNEVKKNRKRIEQLLHSIQEKITVLHDFKTNKTFTNNLDMELVFANTSIQFQYMFFNKEFNHLKEQYNIITNRIYHDYYKLLLMIKNYTKNNKKPIKKYNSLNLENGYKIEETDILIEEVNNQLNICADICVLKKKEIQQLKSQQNKGFHLNNYLNTMKYEYSTIKEKKILYQSLLENFNELHNEYIKYCLKSFEDLYNYLNDMINTNKENDNSPTLSTPSTIKLNEMIDELENKKKIQENNQISNESIIYDSDNESDI